MAWLPRQKLLGAPRPFSLSGLWSAHEHRGSCPFHQAGLTCDRQLSNVSHRFPGARSFASTSSDSAQEREVKPFSSESGFWRQGLPSPEEMKNGKWSGKGRSLVWCQVVETLAQGRRKPTPKAGLRQARPVEFDSTSAAWAQHSSDSTDDSQQSKGWTSEAGFTGAGGRIWGSSGARPQFFTNNAWNRMPCHRKGHHHLDGRRRGPRLSMKEMRFQRAIRMRKGDPTMFKSGLFYFLVVKPRVPKVAPKYRRSVIHDHSRYSATKTPFAPLLSPSLPAPPPSFTAARPSIFSSIRTPFPTAPKPIPGGLQIRSFSSSCRAACIPCVEAVPRAVMQAGIPILVPLLGLLKSTAAINITMIVSRVALTALPLSLRAKFIYALRERYLRDPENASSWLKRLIKMHHPSGEVVNGRAMRVNAMWIVPTLVLAPVLLTIAIIAASFERTPVTGRLRVMMLSPTEEADLVSSILTVGESSRTETRDWVSILQSVLELEEGGYSPTTGRRLLLGGEVLDERDWRVRWTEAVLRRLETGVPMLATANGAAEAAHLQEGLLQPPPTRYPLAPRTTVTAAHELGAKGSLYMGKHRDGSVGKSTEGELACEYDLLVIEREEPNAFSFGFGPDHVDAGRDSKGRRGVVVVYTGFINDILGEAAPISAPPTPPESPRSSGIFSFLGRDPKLAPLPNLEPTILPSREQTQALAVLLSHELAHLVLSHTLESYASTSLLIPHLTKLGSDVIRTLVFPITALLGPFLNDAIGRSMNEGASSGFGVVGQIFNSCSSRTLETEADIVALRLLSYSGIDPRFALDFWEDRLASSITPHSHSHPLPPAPPSNHLRLHSASHALPTLSMASPDGDKDVPDKACKFLRSHPVDEERVQRIRDELVKWVSFRGTEFAV